MHMSQLSFGEFTQGRGYKTVDERVMRGSAGVMLFLAIIASINGFVLDRYAIIPYISGFLALNFLIGIAINPKFSPTIWIAKFMVEGQTPLPIGAIQKKFAWSLGFILTLITFILSLYLQNDVSYFDNVCMLCLICIGLLYLETAFGVCVGCKLYHLALSMKLLKAPEEKPNCMGDACDID